MGRGARSWRMQLVSDPLGAGMLQGRIAVTKWIPSRRRSRAACAAVVATATIGLAAGCGDDDDESGLSKQELIKQANPICKRHFDKISAAANKLLAGGQLPNPREFGKLAQRTIVPEYTAQIKELRALKPSEDVADAYRKWLADSDATRAKIASNPSLITNPANFRAVNGEADKLGLSKQCHIGPG